MTEEEIKQLQQNVINLSNERDQYKTKVEALTGERDQYKQQTEELQKSVNEYRDINSQLALKITTPVNENNSNSNTQKPSENKEVSLTMEDLIKQLD